MKILKEANQNDLENIKGRPDILVEPINDYKMNKSQTFKKNLLNNGLIKFKDMKDLKTLFFKIDTKKENIVLIDNESENNISLSISINNSSFNNLKFDF